MTEYKFKDYKEEMKKLKKKNFIFRDFLLLFLIFSITLLIIYIPVFYIIQEQNYQQRLSNNISNEVEKISIKQLKLSYPLLLNLNKIEKITSLENDTSINRK